MERLPPYLLVPGEEWKARSKELAEWAWERLVNRKGVWGQYTSLSAREKLDSRKSYKARTLPQKKMRGKDMVTLDKLTRHFGSMRRHHLIDMASPTMRSTLRAESPLRSPTSTIGNCLAVPRITGRTRYIQLNEKFFVGGWKTPGEE